MDLEANTEPTNEILKDNYPQSSDDSRHEVKLAYLISLIFFFCVIICPVTIYCDIKDDEVDFVSIACWDCIPQVLGLLSIRLLWQATHENDPNEEFLHVECLSSTFSLMITILFFNLVNKKVPLTYCIISFFSLWFCLMPFYVLIFVIPMYPATLIYYDGRRYNLDKTRLETFGKQWTTELIKSHDRDLRIIIFFILIFIFIFIF
jgi:ferredoxin-like protein FixX